MGQAKEYKDTINLPKTDFPMKGNLPVREPEIIQKWTTMDLHRKQLEKNKNAKKFTLPDGPPYANGNLHMGHALNKILKDIVVKYKNMTGFHAAFVPGWDCHGLPIELSVTKALGKERAEKTDADIRELCRSEARKWISKQKDQFIRYGVLGDWENPYLTLNPEYEAEEVRVLAKTLKTGALYRGEKAVYWCYALQTALAEAEIEYHDHTSPTIYLKFYVKTGLEKLETDKKTAFVIWTTTPWTIPANRAICLNEEFDYSVYDLEGEQIVIADGLKEAFEKDTEKTLTRVTGPFKGKALDGVVAEHPMYNELESPIIFGEHVTLEAGTGAVHTAPGHGQEDFAIGKQYGLEVFSPVNEYGKYTAQVPEYEGTHVFKANPLLIERFQKSGHLIHHGEIRHSYPHCWRSKTPIIFRATPQWFLEMDKGDESIRKRSLRAIKDVNWIPSWGEKRITGMIENRPDWCLSRQRTWGVPIPVFYCKSCDKEHISEEAMLKVADKMEQDGGIEAYFKYDIKDFIGDAECEECGHKEFKRGKDILDVWFDSGVCWSAVQKKDPRLEYPADLYLEGSDQHRGWFHTSLLASVAAEGKAPYKNVLTHGFVMFSKGVKMSKSQGNVVDPQEIIKKNGAELLRVWAAHEDYSQDMSCSPESFARLTETYRRVRNTMRFLLGNLNDFDVTKDAIEYEKLHELDQWALHRLNNLIGSVTECYERYEFFKIYHLLNNYFTVDLSAVYLDILKDRLYTAKNDGHLRRSAQTVILENLNALVGLMAPILSFLSEEVYGHLPNKSQESVFLTEFPKVNSKWENSSLSEKYDRLLKIREKVSKTLEELRVKKEIGSSLEASVDLTYEGEDFTALKSIEPDLRAFFIVSNIELSEGKENVSARKADGEKCVRCWHFSTRIGENADLPGICPKCVEALK